MKTHQTLLHIQENTTGLGIYDPYLQRNLTGTHVNVIIEFKILSKKNTFKFTLFDNI